MSDLPSLASLLVCIVLFAGCNGIDSKWPTNPLEVVSIVDSRNIWIVSNKAELFHLENGLVAEQPFTGNIAAVDFLDSDLGWSLATNGVVFQTRNGGSSWQKIGTVRRNLKGQQPFWTPGRMMRFADEKAGWIVASDSVFRTEDGGHSWQVFDFSRHGAPSQMVIVDSNEFWCVTWTGKVVHTLDGGLNWRTSNLPSQKPGESYPRAIALDAIGRVWVGDTLSKPLLFVSDDRGTTWEEQDLPTRLGKISVLSIQFAPDGTGRVVYRQVSDSNRPVESSMVVAGDNGEEWNIVPIEALPFVPLRVEFVTASAGFLIGESGIAATDDGGTSWKVLYTVPN